MLGHHVCCCDYEAAAQMIVGSDLKRIVQPWLLMWLSATMSQLLLRQRLHRRLNESGWQLMSSSATCSRFAVLAAVCGSRLDINFDACGLGGVYVPG